MVPTTRKSDEKQKYLNLNIYFQINIENRLKYILYSTNNNKTSNTDIILSEEKVIAEANIVKVEAIETMMEAQHLTKFDKSPLTITSIPAFKLPDFLLHAKTCECYVCNNYSCLLLALNIVKLESIMYFRNKEFEIANNYFNGAFKMIDHIKAKFKHLIERMNGEGFEEFLLNVTEDIFGKALRTIELEIFIEYTYFELAQSNNENADDILVKIHELLQEIRDDEVYIKDAYMNLVAAAYKIKETASKTVITEETGLEAEFDNLKLTPNKETDKALQKTPENKPQKISKDTKIPKIINDDEIPKMKLRIKKLNLDNTSPDKENNDKKIDKKDENNEFKMPVPKTVKAQPEMPTPRPTRAKPKVLVTQSTTENNDKDCFTPKEKVTSTKFYTPITKDDALYSTPVNSEEQFFTPMSTIKTYSSKKNLRQQIVKNLENEFVTPNCKSVKEEKNDVKKKITVNSRDAKIETGSLRAVRDKRTLRRATSPGKLPASNVTGKNRAKVIVSPDEDVTKKSNLRSRRQ